MKNKYLLLFVFLIFSIFSVAQTYNMPNGANGTTSTCSGTFTDGAGDYASNSNSTRTFCPSTPGDKVRITFTAFDTESGLDYLDVWFANAVGAAGTQDDRFMGSPTVPFTITSTSPDGCLSFRFISDSSLEYAGFTATISCVTPCTPPIAALVNSSTVDICPSTSLSPGSSTVVFNASASTTTTGSVVRYEWDWGDGTSNVTLVPNTTHNFPTTGGLYVVRLRVRNNNFSFDPLGCLSTNSVTRTIRVMPEPSFVGTSASAVGIACGSSVTLNGLAVSQTIIQTTPSVISGPINLPDGSGSSYDSNLDFSGLFTAGATITPGCYPTVTFDIEHSYTGDLDIILISPSGESVILFDQHAPVGSGHFGACSDGDTDGVPGCPATYSVVSTGGASWTAVASTTVTPPTVNGLCSYTGVCETGGSYYIPQTYTSTNSFTALNGASMNGVWTLQVIDNIGSDDGVLSNWSLTFPSSCYSSLQTITPDLATATWSHAGVGPAVPFQTTTSTVVTNPGPACPSPGPCIGNQLANNVTIGPFPTSGSYIYSLTVTDEFGCQYRRNVSVNVAPCSSCALALTSTVGSNNQTVCLNSAVSSISYSYGGSATGATVTGLPAGLTATIGAGVITISGSPTASGTFNYSVTTIGCTPILTLNGTITVTPLNTIVAGTNQTVCINTAIASITLATTGATGATFSGLPAGVTGSWAANVATISGTPTSSGTFNYTVTTTGGCPPAATTGTITVTPLNTIASGTNQTVCINTAIASITLATTGATGVTFSGLPAGVTGSWAANVATISGTPTSSGTFNYTVTTTGGCPPAATTGTITVTPLNTIASGTNQTVCINTAIASITLATTGATGVTFSGLPAGVTGSWAANVATISGTPTSSGTFNYTVTTTGGCPPAATTGTITVTPLNTIASGTNQTVCINTAIASITLATTGATGVTFSGLPAGVTGSWAANVATISGTPTSSGTFNYTVTTTGGCPPAATTGTITVTPLNTIASGTNQTVCINTAIASITLATTGATGVTFSGLPAGVTGSWAANVATISGTPTSSGTFNYTVTTTGGCPPAATTGTITVTPLNTIASGTNQTVCINTAIASITLATTGATGATFSGLPAGVTGSWAANVATISGTPTSSGTFNYTVTTTGGCPPAATTGTITVTPLNTIASGTNQTVCINTAIASITLATTGATGVTFSGLPAGVTGSWAANVATISGTPTSSGTFNYTVTTTGGCPPAATTGTITVTPLNTIASGTNQTVCINTAIASITLATTGATGATFSGLPVGVTGSWAANVATISGTPTSSGTFNYTVTTTGGCPPAATTGTITVTPLNTIASGTNQTVCINTAIASITLATTGATGVTFSGLPAGVTGSWAANVATISGTPTSSGTFNYTVTTTGGCPPAATTGTITVTPLNTIASGTNQTVCINTAIASITLATTGATGATFSGLPVGVTGSWAANVATISGTPTSSGTFNYTVTTTGGCPPAATTGTITVTPLNTIASGTNQTVCINTAIASITLATTGATGATFSGLPAGVTGSWAANVATISGTPTSSGTFNYTVTTTGGCPPAATTGTITVTPLNTIASGTNQTVCINTAIASITLATTGATGVTFSGLPAGVTGSWAANVATISGTPTSSGTFNYTVTTTGGCPPAATTGTITVTPLNTIASGTNQTVCINTAIASITLATTGATGATFSGLPVGVTGSWAANVATISGTPTSSGTFNYTVTTTGGCPPAATTGTITVTPLNTIASGTNQTVCINTAIASITLATTGATGATFSGLPAGVTGSWAANVATISGTPTSSGTFNYTVITTGGCPPAATTGTITVNELPTAAINYSQPQYCYDSSIISVTLTGTGSYIGGTYSATPAGLSINSITGTITPSLSTPGNYTVSYLVPSNGACTSYYVTTSVSITPKPVLSYTVTNSICDGSPLDFDLNSNVSGTTFDWSISSSYINPNNGTPVGFVFVGTGESALNQVVHLLNPMADNGSLTVAILPTTSNGCVGDLVTVNLQIKPVPVATIVAFDNTLCSGETLHLVFNAQPSNNTTFTWTAVNNNGVIITSGIYIGTSTTGILDLQLTTAFPTLQGSIEFEITPFRNGCQGLTVSTGLIYVNPIPSAPILVPVTPICSGDPAGLIITNFDNTILEWEVVASDNVTGFVQSGSGQSPLTISDILLNESDNQGFVTYRVTSVSGDCRGQYTDFTVLVNPLPKPLLTDGHICVNASTGLTYQGYLLDAQLSGSNLTYQWFMYNEVTTVYDPIAGANASTYEAMEEGSYQVIVTNTTTGCIGTSSAEVNEVFPATAFTATVSDAFTNNSTITVTVNPIGTGNLIYALDEGAWQDSNVFTGVEAGEHKVLVSDLEGCTNLTIDVTVIDYPKYFTPNGDGIHDTWNIVGLNQTDAKLFIFDRYGKLIKQISTVDGSKGWDGMYKGAQMPSTDYWFTIDFTENNQQKQFKSHFSLKR